MTQLQRRDNIDPGLAYVLWIAGLFGMCGIHRFYLGRWGSGLLWLFTGGLCFVGQFVDLIMMRRMIDDAKNGGGGF